MKKNLIILVLVFAFAKLYGQEYYVIDFAGEGATIESIYVENLTQGTSVELEGTDVLHLVLESNTVLQMEMESKKLTIFPNPMEQTCNIEFINAKEGSVSITLYSITGKQILNFNNNLSKGTQNFSLSGLSAGTYVISVKTETNLITGRLVSTNQKDVAISLIHEGKTQTTDTEKSPATTTLTLRNKSGNKENKSIVEMDYNIGDQMKFTGYAESYFNSFIYDSPTDDKTYTLKFILKAGQCDGIAQFTDSRDGNVYNTIGIGGQCWMAENLKYLPMVHSLSEFITVGNNNQLGFGVYGYDGNDVDTAKTKSNYLTYGVLYNWWAAMDGANSSSYNPSGVKGVCPNGWHLPSSTEWRELTDYLKDNGYSYDSVIGGYNIFKSMSASQGWNSSSITGAPGNSDYPEYQNKSGFSALPAGYRNFYDMNSNDTGLGDWTGWWSSTDCGPACVLEICNRAGFGDCGFVTGMRLESTGFSIRCVRD